MEQHLAFLPEASGAFIHVSQGWSLVYDHHKPRFERVVSLTRHGLSNSARPLFVWCICFFLLFFPLARWPALPLHQGSPLIRHESTRLLSRALWLYASSQPRPTLYHAHKLCPSHLYFPGNRTEGTIARGGRRACGFPTATWRQRWARLSSSTSAEEGTRARPKAGTGRAATRASPRGCGCNRH